MNKRGQLKISFGMIFSIILIIMFLSFAFYSISGFLSLQDSVQTKKFIEGFQDKVNELYTNQVYGANKLEFSTPDSLEKICFVDRIKNLEIWQDGYPDSEEIKNIDIIKTLDGKENLCIKAVKNKIKFRIELEYGDSTITIKEAENETE